MNAIVRIMVMTGASVAMQAAVGCNIVVPAAYIIGGQDKQPAVFELQDRPTVVFVDDRRNIINGRVALRRMIGEKASQELMIQKVLTTTISPRDAIAVAQEQDKANKPLAMDELARAVGADQIVYVEMQYFSMSPDGVTVKPTAVCLVRVVDAVGRTRLFPPPQSDQPTFQVQASLRDLPPEAARTPSAVRELEDKLAAALGDQLAKMFYKHVPDEIGSHLQG